MVTRGPIKSNSRAQRWQREMEDSGPWQYVEHGYDPEGYAGPGLLDRYPLKNWVHLRNSNDVDIVVGDGQARHCAGWIIPRVLPKTPTIRNPLVPGR